MSPASTGAHISSDGLRCREGFEASFQRTSFPLLLLISHPSVIFALAFGEHRRAFVPAVQPISSAFCLHAKVFWAFIFGIPVPWIPKTTILCTLLLILEARLLMPVLNCPWPVILYCKDGFPTCATSCCCQILESAELLSELPRRQGMLFLKRTCPQGNIPSTTSSCCTMVLCRLKYCPVSASELSFPGPLY